MVCRDTLKIKNLPKELSDGQKEEFARHFGAVKVKVVPSRIKEKAVVYAKFDSPELAKNVLFRLHQTTVLNCVLCVEYAPNDELQGKPPLRKFEEKDETGTKYFKTFINKLTAFNDSVGFHQPPPAHLKYMYPKANRATINNIGHALATIPKFYVQVLHLMNRMNLPPPFAVEQPQAVKTVPSVNKQKLLPVAEKQQHQPQSQPTTSAPQQEQLLKEETKESSEESEYESEEDSFKNKDIVPVKRKSTQKKTVKRPKFIKPLVVQTQSAQKVEKVEDVFEKTEVQVPKKIELKVISTSLEQPQVQPVEASAASSSPEKSNSTVDSLQSTTVKILDSEEPKDDEDGVITAEELAANQIPHKDLSVLPVFKNYHPGVPTCRLYIKNCAKTVVEKDLLYIYSRYKLPKQEGKEDKPSEFNIRLMQEGKMKGQAFVTLDSVELAQKAVKETNGYILKEKPLVVAFARSVPSKK